MLADFLVQQLFFDAIIKLLLAIFFDNVLFVLQAKDTGTNDAFHSNSEVVFSKFTANYAISNAPELEMPGQTVRRTWTTPGLKYNIAASEKGVRMCMNCAMTTCTCVFTLLSHRNDHKMSC